MKLINEVYVLKKIVVNKPKIKNAPPPIRSYLQAKINAMRKIIFGIKCIKRLTKTS